MVPSDWCDAAAAGGCGHSRESPSPRSLGHGRGAPEAPESRHGAAPRSEYSRGSDLPAAQKAACKPQLSGVTQLSVLPAATRRRRAPDAVPVPFFSKTRCGDRACF